MAPDMIDSSAIDPVTSLPPLPARPSCWAGNHSIMPHLIFQIDEVLRPIAEYVGQLCRPTAIDFARCCRAFEEPALRPLWESTTLGNLLHLLPEDVLYFGGPGICVVCVPPCWLSDQLSAERWRFRGYSASSLQPNAGGCSSTHRGSEESQDS